jgi:hypothetical protein
LYRDNAEVIFCVPFGLTVKPQVRARTDEVTLGGATNSKAAFEMGSPVPFISSANNRLIRVRFRVPYFWVWELLDEQ